MRGWGTLGDASLGIITDKKEYSLGEKIIITMKNIGDATLMFNCKASFTIFDEFENSIKLPLDKITPPCDAIFPYGPNSETTLVWSQKDAEKGQVKPGNYTVVTDSFSPWHLMYFYNSQDVFSEEEFRTTTFKITDQILLDSQKIANVVITTDKDTYKLGEEIKITITNRGKSNVFVNYDNGLSIVSENGNVVKSQGSGYGGKNYNNQLFPLEVYILNWNQKDYKFKNEYVSPGTYIIKTDFLDVEKNTHKISTQFDIVIPDEYHNLKEIVNPEFLSYFHDAENVFVGKLKSKIRGTSPEFFQLNFVVDEYFKYFPASGNPWDMPLKLNITTHEGAYQNCILTEGQTYLIFASDEYGRNYDLDQHCFWAVKTPNDIVEKLRKISAALYD